MASNKRIYEDTYDHIDKKIKTNRNQDVRFKHGNYNRYYGYRNAEHEEDKRIALFKKDWFEHKMCLDIGCNVGHLTLWIAKYFHPSKIKGVDIDPGLIKAAKNNVMHYVEDSISNKETTEISVTKSESISSEMTCEQNSSSEINTVKDSLQNDTFEKKKIDELSNNTLNGVDRNSFPYNVCFITENFVPASLDILKHTKAQYDLIMCLSVTKWIQLNSGDNGLMLMFKKIYKLLNPGGLFILEPQSFQSYRRRKNLTSEIRKNFDKIKLKPEQYKDYLLSDEVGFSKCEQIDITKHEKQGFQRPLYVLTKD